MSQFTFTFAEPTPDDHAQKIIVAFVRKSSQDDINTVTSFLGIKPDQMEVRTFATTPELLSATLALKMMGKKIHLIVYLNELPVRENALNFLHSTGADALLYFDRRAKHLMISIRPPIAGIHIPANENAAKFRDVFTAALRVERLGQVRNS